MTNLQNYFEFVLKKKIFDLEIFVDQVHYSLIIEENLDSIEPLHIKTPISTIAMSIKGYLLKRYHIECSSKVFFDTEEYLHGEATFSLKNTDYLTHISGTEPESIINGFNLLNLSECECFQ